MSLPIFTWFSELLSGDLIYFCSWKHMASKLTMFTAQRARVRASASPSCQLINYRLLKFVVWPSCKLITFQADYWVFQTRGKYDCIPTSSCLVSYCLIRLCSTSRCIWEASAQQGLVQSDRMCRCLYQGILWCYIWRVVSHALHKAMYMHQVNTLIDHYSE